MPDASRFNPRRSLSLESHLRQSCKRCPVAGVASEGLSEDNTESGYETIRGEMCLQRRDDKNWTASTVDQIGKEMRKFRANLKQNFDRQRRLPYDE